MTAARRGGRLWLLGAAVVATLAAAVAASAWVIANPRVDHPTRADAVVVLSGDLGGRFPKGLSLVREGVAPALVVAGLADLPETKAMCTAPPPASLEVHCLLPRPDTTRTEAQAVGRLAREKGWRHIVIVTDRYHIERARLLFDRCVDATVSAVAALDVPGTRPLTRQLAHEWLAIADALVVARSC